MSGFHANCQPDFLADNHSDFQTDLPAARVHALLQKSLIELQRAEKCAVLWFAEIATRKLFVELGYASIHQYAAEALGFSRNKTYHLLRLAADLERLPVLRESVAKGEVGWTKAREVVKVADQDSHDAQVLRRRNSASGCRVIVHKCETCSSATIPTSRGEKRIGAAALAAAECDAVIQREGKRNSSTIPPSVRQAVLARDRYRCQSTGCGNTRFLEIHHVVPRSRGGSNRAENLTTLCSRCHAFSHRQATINRETGVREIRGERNKRHDNRVEEKRVEREPDPRLV